MENTLSAFLRSGYPVEAERKDLLEMNGETAQYGLQLSQAEAAELAKTHRTALVKTNRVEIGHETVRKIIHALSRSQFLPQTRYADVLNEAVYAFYELKNESEDKMTDDELIENLADGFEEYEGDMDAYLQSCGLDGLLRKIRYGLQPEEDEKDDGDDEKEEPDE